MRARAFGDIGPAALTVTDAAGAELARRPWRPEPGAAASFTIPLPARVRGAAVTARLDAGGDALAADSSAALLPTPARPVRAVNALPPGPARDAVARALAAVPGVTVTNSESPDLLFKTPEAAAGRLSGFRPAETWTVAVGPLPGDAGEPPADAAGPFLIDRADPLTAGLSLAGTVWGGAGGGRELPGVGPVAPVVAAGDRVLVGRAAGGGIVVNADLARGTLARTPDWPILLANIIAARRAALPGPDRVNLRLGETARLTLTDARAAADGPLELVRLSDAGDVIGDPAALPREPVVPVAPPAAGLWAVRDPAGNAELARFAVRLADAREADLTLLSAGVREAAGDAAGTRTDDPAPWPVAALALLALAVVVADWWVTRPA